MQKEEDKQAGEEIRTTSMTTLRKCKQANPTDRSSDNSDQENTPQSSQCRSHKMARRQLSTSNTQTAVLDKIDEDSRRRAAFEENILVGSAAKRMPTAASSCPSSRSSCNNATSVLCTCHESHLS